MVFIAFVKCLQPKSDKLYVYKVIPKIRWVFLLSPNLRQMLFVRKGSFLKKVVPVKEVVGGQCSSMILENHRYHVKSSTTLEVVLEFSNLTKWKTLHVV